MNVMGEKNEMITFINVKIKLNHSVSDLASKAFIRRPSKL